jgi:bromodomain-containing protein 7/9
MGMRDDRKDDYAFFLSPVDPARVPGYADVIKCPMDLGTMSTKVAKGKYRSLEEFTVSIALQ